MERRAFLATAAGGLAAAGALSGCARAEGSDRATVVVVKLPGVAKLPRDQRRPLLERMVTAGMERLTSQTGEAAWQAVFKPSDEVVLKINGLGHGIATSPDLADVVAGGVLRAGVAEAACRLFDRNTGDLTANGFAMGRNAAGYTVVSTDQPGIGYDAAEHTYGVVRQRVTRLLTERTTAIVNLPILKDHNIAGLTGALKNHYGSIMRPDQLHQTNCDPAIPDVCCLPPIAGKHRLCVGDALTMLYHGGPFNRPSSRLALDSIVLSRDPVAHDVVFCQLLEAVRKDKGLRPLAREGREPRYLKTAGDPARGLGISDPTRIDVIRIDLS